MVDFRKVPTTSDRILRVALEKSDTNRATIITHNWADKTTWYSESIRVDDEVAADSGDHQLYQLANAYLIDTYHGKITQEDFLTDNDGYDYRVVVKVNDVQKTEQDPHYGAGGDYTINYVDGYVEFLSALQPEDVVTVAYHYASSSIFTVQPPVGKIWKLEIVEVQFSQDVKMKDTIRYNAYGNVEVFAPQYCPVPYPPGTSIPLGNPTVFKTITDLMNDAVRAYPAYNPIGGSSWRGLSQPATVMDWDYRSSIILHGSYGMSLAISLDHDEQFGGTFATATFYCKEEDDEA